MEKAYKAPKAHKFSKVKVKTKSKVIGKIHEKQTQLVVIENNETTEGFENGSQRLAFNNRPQNQKEEGLIKKEGTQVKKELLIDKVLEN